MNFQSPNKVTKLKLNTKLKTFLCFTMGSSVFGFIFTFIIITSFIMLLQYQLILRSSISQIILIAVIYAITIAFMITTTVTDPGIIPPIMQGFQYMTQNFSIPYSRIDQSSLILTVNNKVSRIKFCDVCRIYKPSRTIHCSVCNHCVKRFDHHCPWIGVCIGKRNYRYFIGFLVGGICLISCSLGFSINMFIRFQQSSNLGKSISSNIIIFVIMVIAGFFLLLISPFLIYHIRLMKLGLTTNQDLKDLYGQDNIPNPFGIFSTCQNNDVLSLTKKMELWRLQMEQYRQSGKIIEISDLSSSRNTNMNPLLINQIKSTDK